MTSQTVWLVLDGDREPLDVCDSEPLARALAHAQGGTAEEWPLTISDERRAWLRAARSYAQGFVATPLLVTERAGGEDTGRWGQ